MRLSGEQEKGRVNAPAGGYYRRMNRKRGRPPHDDLLTPAEWRTVNFVRHGLTNAQIAARQGVSLDAIKYHVANAIAKLGVANRKALKTWGGAPKDSLLRTGDKTMNDEIRYTGMGQVARSATDIAAAETWYRDVLGLDHLFTFGNLAFFDCGGTRLMISEAENGPGDESLLYLRVPDIGPVAVNPVRPLGDAAADPAVAGPVAVSLSVSSDRLWSAGRTRDKVLDVLSELERAGEGPEFPTAHLVDETLQRWPELKRDTVWRIINKDMCRSRGGRPISLVKVRKAVVKAAEMCTVKRSLMHPPDIRVHAD